MDVDLPEQANLSSSLGASMGASMGSGVFERMVCCLGSGRGCGYCAYGAYLRYLGCLRYFSNRRGGYRHCRVTLLEVPIGWYGWHWC